MLETQGFFNIDGVNLEYQLLTPHRSAALTLVLLHEGLGCVAMWKNFPRQLAELTGCPVLAYSRSGYGGSSPCPLPRSPGFMHDEALKVLPKVLDAAEVQKAVLVGHSDGASIALINVGGLVDGRILGLILMAPHVFVEELTITSIAAVQSAYRKAGLRKQLARYHGDRVDYTFLGWSQIWLQPEFRDWNIEAYLPQIKLPVLLIQGRDDNYGTLLQLEKITAKLPGDTEVIILSDCDHAPFRDRPAETLQAIEAFLSHNLKEQFLTPG